MGWSHVTGLTVSVKLYSFWYQNRGLILDGQHNGEVKEPHYCFKHPLLCVVFYIVIFKINFTFHLHWREQLLLAMAINNRFYQISVHFREIKEICWKLHGSVLLACSVLPLYSNGRTLRTVNYHSLSRSRFIK